MYKPFYIRPLLVSTLLCCIAGCSETESISQANETRVVTEQNKRPNFVIIVTDDQRVDSLAMFGHPATLTPNIDALASKGVVFNNAFVTSAICTPSRTSILTGKYERSHGITFHSRSAMNDEAFAKSYPMILKDSGYFVGYVGKNHIPIGKSGSGFGYDSGIFESSFDYWYGNNKHIGFYLKDRHPVYRNAKADTQVEILLEGANNFFEQNIEFAQGNPLLKERPMDKPFALPVNFNVPHAASTGKMESRSTDPELYRTTYRDSINSLPIPDTYVTFEAIEQQKLPKSVYANKPISSYAYSKTEATLREHMVKELQTITGIDQFIGSIVATLKKQELEDNTVILLISDHGVMQGEFGLGGKTLVYDPSIRVPLIIYDPRADKADNSKRVNELALNIDVHPTILELAGIEVPDGVQGRSLIPVIQGQTRDWRDDFFVENMFMGQGYPRLEAVRSARFKFIRYFDPNKNQTHIKSLTASILGEQPIYEELFDLQQDPQEITNLINHPEYVDVTSQMRSRVQELLLEAKGAKGAPLTYIQD